MPPTTKLTDDERRLQVAEITTELYRAGLVTATGGNVSIRSTERPDAAWITPSQIFKGALRPEQMILIDMEGNKLAGETKPSVESRYHAGVLKLRPEIHAVIHTHAPLATVVGMCDVPILPITTEAVMMMDIPTLPWYFGGTADLAQDVIAHLGHGGKNGAFLRNHGLITIGRTLREAADMTYMIEHTCKILLACASLGRAPSVIPEQDVQAVGRYLAALAMGV